MKIFYGISRQVLVTLWVVVSRVTVAVLVPAMFAVILSQGSVFVGKVSQAGHVTGAKKGFMGILWQVAMVSYKSDSLNID